MTILRAKQEMHKLYKQASRDSSIIYSRHCGWCSVLHRYHRLYRLCAL